MADGCQQVACAMLDRRLVFLTFAYFLCLRSLARTNGTRSTHLSMYRIDVAAATAAVAADNNNSSAADMKVSGLRVKAFASSHFSRNSGFVPPELNILCGHTYFSSHHLVR